MKKQVIFSVFTLLLLLSAALNGFAQNKTYTAGQQMAAKRFLDGKWYISTYVKKSGGVHEVTFTKTTGGGITMTIPDANTMTMEDAKKQGIAFENAGAGSSSAGTASANTNTNNKANTNNNTNTNTGNNTNTNTNTASNEVNPQHKEMLRILINDYRKSKDGRGPLASNAALDKAAQDYANLLEQTGKFSHEEEMTSPNSKVKVTDYADRVIIAALSLAGSNPATPFLFSFVSANAVSHVVNLSMSENIAEGYGTPQSALDGWKSSTMGHDQNMRDANWTNIGIGIAKRKLPNGTYSGYVWVTMFGKANTDVNTQVNLDGTYKGKLFDAKYQYYNRFIKG